MAMKLKRDPNESALSWAERCLVSGRYPGPLWARFLKGCIYLARRNRNRLLWKLTARRTLGKFRDRDLVYAAGARCKCGAGLAYPHGAGIGSFRGRRLPGEWDCSAVLKGETPPTNEHPTFPFAFYEIKSECQPSAAGATTRPGVKRVRHGALWNTYVPAQ